ncbi:CHAT domain-containing protein [Mycena galopus ATCC 62051]|nr:CHAT domain-containing protein [Mycena galopus ATCC 62051]
MPSLCCWSPVLAWPTGKQGSDEDEDPSSDGCYNSLDHFAMINNQEELALTPEGHPDRAGRLLCLAVSFADRYRRLGDLTDLKAALQNKQEALALTPEGHPRRAGRLYSLAVSLADRYQRLGDLTDLEAALQNYQEALALTPKGHLDHAQCLQSLAASFTNRYRRLGDLTDLEAALQIKQEALALTPEGHPSCAGRLHNLAVSLGDRYQRLGDLTDLEAALQNDQEALALTPKGHLDRARCLQSLAASFTDRYRRLGDLTDLEAALQNNQEALALTPEGHPRLAPCLQSLAASFTDRYRRLGDLTDLEAALQNNQEALALTPEGHPSCAGCLQDLAVSFTARYQRLRDSTDLESIFSNYALSFEGNTLDSVASWKAALTWASLAQDHRPSDCLKAYSAAFHLLPDILWVGNSLLAHQDVTRRINITHAISNAVATCIEYFNLTLAIELLEQGLATTFKLLLQLKPSGDALLPKADDDQLKLLSSELFSGKSQNPHGVAIKRNALIKDIRTHPGFEHFLLPHPYQHLCQASENGPIIILNSHNDHCDGIILLHPTLDPLHNIRAREAESIRLHGRSEGWKSSEQFFEDMLAWLWSHIVVHLYKAMELYFSSSMALMMVDCGGALWSYTSTLEALLDANSKKPPSSMQTIGVVGVTHHEPAGTGALPGVQQEINKIVSIVGGQNVQSLLGNQATVEAVKLQLQDCSWVHLACHGQQNLQDPPRSCLQLYEGILDLETILRMPLSHAEFVFLAACQTGMGDAELANESFHLGGGFIAAGFRGAIGTMWSMLDPDGPVLAEAIYTHLFSNGKKPQATDVAKALQLAVRKLRDSGVSYERWVPFIHLGI